jgi:hypothetical protein
MKRTNRILPVLLLFAGLLATMRAPGATLPDGLKSGGSPQSSGALVTLALPSIVGVNVAHNFVLDFNSGTKCYGSSSTQGTFPQAASGTTTYTFAVTVTPYDPTNTNVACPGANAQPDLATVQILSSATGSRLQASIQDGGWGAQATALTNLIADIFSQTRLKMTTSDGCGGGTPVSPMNLGTSAGNVATTIPKTGWADCKQKLTLTLAAGTAVAAGTASGTLTFTMSNP